MNRPLLKYYGSKFRLAHWITSVFPKHRRYVDVFGGGASVLLAKSPVGFEVYNDLDSRVVNFFRVLRDHGDELIRLIDLTPWSKEEWALSKHTATDAIEDARRFYVLCWQSISNPGSGWSRGRIKHGRGSRSNGEDSIRGLRFAIDRFKTVCIEQDDYASILARYDSRDTLFYVDPPYLATARFTQAAYSKEFNTEEEHIELAGKLSKIQGLVVLSGYRSALYDALYQDWRCLMKRTQTNSNNGTANIECLWLSPNTATPQVPLAI